MESGEGREAYPSSREKVDYSDFREEMGGKEERPNRPHSRDSTLSKESRGSKEGKGTLHVALLILHLKHMNGLYMTYILLAELI